MPDHDELFKELLRNFLFEFLDFAKPEFSKTLNRAHAIQLDTEFSSEFGPGRAQRADLVFQVLTIDTSENLLIHVEFESSHKPAIEERMFHYYALLRKKYSTPIIPIAIFSYRSPRKPVSSRIDFDIQATTVGFFQFQPVQLNRLRWKDHLSMQNPVVSALMSCMWHTEIDRPEVKLECLRHLSALDLPFERVAIILKFIDAYLDLESWEKPVFDQKLACLIRPEKEKIMTYITSWQKEGMEKGRVEGRAEGLAEGESRQSEKLVKRLLVKKFGTLSAELSRLVKNLSVQQLEQLAEDLLEFLNISDLVQWLDSQSKTTGDPK